MDKLKIFSYDQCEEIVRDFEVNKEHIKLSTDHGVERISSYEIDYKHFSPHVKKIIDKAIERVIDITGGKVGMIFGVKYTLDTKSYMAAHYDCNSYSCVIKLNDDYKGGGTYFPLTGKIVNPKEIGQGVLFRADKIKSYHEAYPITEGVRYVLVVRIEKKNIIHFFIKMIFLHFVDKWILKRKDKYYKNPIIE